MSYFIYTDLMESLSWSKTCWSWINFLLSCIWPLIFIWTESLYYWNSHNLHETKQYRTRSVTWQNVHIIENANKLLAKALEATW